MREKGRNPAASAMTVRERTPITERGQHLWGRDWADTSFANVALVSRPKSYSSEPFAQDGLLETTATLDPGPIELYRGVGLDPETPEY